MRAHVNNTLLANAIRSLRGVRIAQWVWPRIWTRNTVEPMRTSGTGRDSLGTGTSLTCSYETECIGGAGDWLAHNPEVAGSNPVPATKESGLDQAKRPPASAGGRLAL